MKITTRAFRGIKLLSGSPILRFDGAPRFASTVIPTNPAKIGIDDKWERDDRRE
jgi:hypothetical protein